MHIIKVFCFFTYFTMLRVLYAMDTKQPVVIKGRELIANRHASYYGDIVSCEGVDLPPTPLSSEDDVRFKLEQKDPRELHEKIVASGPSAHTSRDEDFVTKNRLSRLMCCCFTPKQEKIGKEKQNN